MRLSEKKTKESMSKTELTRQELIEKRDKESPSPEQRAVRIWSAINAMEPRPTLWDIVCFSCEALAALSTELDFLQPFTKRLVSIVYTAHYHTPEPYPSAVETPKPPPSNGLIIMRNDSFIR